MKKLISRLAILICLAMTICLLSSCADNVEADDDPTDGLTPSEGLEFTLNEDGSSYTLSGVGDFTGTELVVPSTYEGMPVTAIGFGAFIMNSTLESVVLPNSVEKIEACAFAMIGTLKSFNCGNGVTFIGDTCFADCTELTELILSNKLETIDKVAFMNTGLKTIDIPKSVTTIGADIFSATGIETVNYAGSESDWENIDLDSNNSNLMDAEFSYGS